MIPRLFLIVSLVFLLSEALDLRTGTSLKIKTGTTKSNKIDCSSSYGGSSSDRKASCSTGGSGEGDLNKWDSIKTGGSLEFLQNGDELKFKEKLKISSGSSFDIEADSLKLVLPESSSVSSGTSTTMKVKGDFLLELMSKSEFKSGSAMSNTKGAGDVQILIHENAKLSSSSSMHFQGSSMKLDSQGNVRSGGSLQFSGDKDVTISQSKGSEIKSGSSSEFSGSDVSIDSKGTMNAGGSIKVVGEKIVSFTQAESGDIKSGSSFEISAPELQIGCKGTISAGSSIELVGEKKVSLNQTADSSTMKSGSSLEISADEVAVVSKGKLSAGSSVKLEGKKTTSFALGTVSAGSSFTVEGANINGSTKHIQSGSLFLCSDTRMSFISNGSIDVFGYCVIDSPEEVNLVIGTGSQITIGTKPSEGQEILEGQNDMTISSGKKITIDFQDGGSFVSIQGSLRLKAPEIHLNDLTSLCVQETLKIEADKLEVTLSKNKSEIVVNALELKDGLKFDSSKIEVKENPECKEKDRGSMVMMMYSTLETCEGGTVSNGSGSEKKVKYTSASQLSTVPQLAILISAITAATMVEL